jgi:hypothetical protein
MTQRNPVLVTVLWEFGHLIGDREYSNEPLVFLKGWKFLLLAERLLCVNITELRGISKLCNINKVGLLFTL